MRFYSVLFLFFFSVFLLTSGGRIASSDETAFFLEAQSLVEHGTLAIPDSVVSNGVYGQDGRFYVGGGLGFTLIAMPFYLLGKLVTTAVSVAPTVEILIHKACFSLTNQIICALIGCIFFCLCRHFGYAARLSFFLTCALLFTTNLFPYSKSAMREPLLTLTLVLAFYFLVRHRTDRRSINLHGAGFSLFLLINTKVSMLIVLPVFAFYWLSIFEETRRSAVPDWRLLKNPVFWRHSLPLLGWLLLAAAVILTVNWIEFGSFFASGYTSKPQPFTTPLFTGLYGLLLSPGKSFFLYAPVTVLLFWSWRNFRDRFAAEFIFIALLALVLLVLHAKYFAWAGDGSWGPRYLIPLLPFCLLVVGARFHFILEQSGKIFKFAALLLALTGVIIQIGGLSVYYGSYLRYLGEFPYTRSFEDPEFMVKSHFVPDYSPVIGHWRLLEISLEKEWAGFQPKLALEKSRERLPVKDPATLVYAIDYWFMYAKYAGIPNAFIWSALLLQMFFVVLFGAWSLSAIRKDRSLVG